MDTKNAETDNAETYNADMNFCRWKSKSGIVKDYITEKNTVIMGTTEYFDKTIDTPKQIAFENFENWK